MLVLITLNEHGTLRFNRIHKEMCDISQRMLTVTLRSLEEDGLISRRVYPEVPPRVEYTLTDMGRSLLPHLDSLIGWALSHMNEIDRNRKTAAARS